ncbi:hypothetical protein [Brevibacillus brevis]|uniref:hypothetical protein n=1 Tax=Brevibacillus brevis TaxID=1393 RepID=UPI00059F133D|nr:hypothetical protein [Brevibacillus brevis]
MKNNTITSSHVDLERNAQADAENSNGEATNQNINRSSQNKISEEQKRPNKGKKTVALDRKGNTSL